MNSRFAFRPRKKNRQSPTPRPPCPHRPAFDTLEDRVLLSGTSLVLGTVFLDLNTNGIQDSGEPGLPGRTVFADVNDNGQLDSGEIGTTTDAGGHYTLDLPTGQYTIGAVPGPDETPTAPAADSYDVTVTDGFASAGRDFGVLFVIPLEPVPQRPSQVPTAAESNQAYVENLYRDILGRNAEPQGLSAWESQLNQGATRFHVAQQIWNSVEHRGLQVESYYQDILHRPSDAGGKAFWVNAMVSGAGEVEVVDRFLTSAEYSRTHATDAAFVDGLYNDLLGRQADANGRADWLLALQQGATRHSVVAGFLFSTESITRLVNSYYSAYLDRLAEPQGLASWTRAVQTGALSPAQAGESILASEEKFHLGLEVGGRLGASGPTDFPLVAMPTKDNQPKIWTGTKGDKNNVVFSSQALLDLNRTITITNNDPENEIFPFFQANNSRPVFDTNDTPNQEYRAYFGYQKMVDGNPVAYLGLLPGEHITVKIPLVFWDSGRIYYTTDPRYVVNQLPNLDVTNNPFLYYATDADGQATRRYIDDGTKPDTTIVSDPTYKQPPAVLYYHAQLAQGVTQAAPAGFVEASIKDPAQGTTTINNPPTTGIDLGPLVSYDLTFVDTVSLPGVLEAPGANVPQSAPGYAPTQAPFGWVGAPEPLDTFQTFVGRFTGNNPGNPLGDFFGARGWPQYYVTPVASGPSVIQVPATKNVFEQGPLKATAPGPYLDGPNSSVQHYLMATGGIFYQAATGNINGNGMIAAGSNIITNVAPSVLATLTAGMLIRDAATLTLPLYTSIKKIDHDTNSIELTGSATQASTGAYTFNGSTFAGPDYSGNTNGQAKRLMLNNPSVLANLQPDMIVTGKGINGTVRIASISANVINLMTEGNATIDSAQDDYVFLGGVNDYAAQGLLNLWYAWADYYVAYVQGQNPFTGPVTGTIGPDNLARITLNSDANLYVGMGVSNLTPGLLPAGTVITSFGSKDDPTNKRIVNLSKFASQQFVGSGFTGDFTFALPAQIDRSQTLVPFDMNLNPDRLTFSNGATSDDKAEANAYAAVVYSVMSAFSGIPGNKSDGPNHDFDSLAFLQNIIGGNIAQIPGIGDIGTPLALAIRDQSKSLERGVVDFNAVPPYDWYANPAVPAGNLLTGGKATFNAYSLDPFVWFTHEYLGVSAYAFSLDDDAANPNVTGARAVDISVGGITPFKNKAEWSPGTEFGPVPSTLTTPTVMANLDATTSELTNVTPDVFPYLNSVVQGASNGALVIGPGVGIAQGLEALARFGGDFDPIVDPNNHLIHLLGGQLTNASAGNYVFFGPTHVTGTIDSQTDLHKISNLSADDFGVLRTLIAKQTLPSALLLRGPGVKPGTTIKALGQDNSIILDDAHPLDPNVAGLFRFTII